MKNTKLEKGKKALVIVAHPDDETIWMGGTIITNPQVDWTICSLCRASDIDRAPKFKKVCDFYKSKSIILDLDDEDKLSYHESILEINNEVKNLLKEDYDYIFTHGKNGEYGHEKHVAVYTVIDSLIKNREIKNSLIFYFNYKLTKNNKCSLEPRKDSNFVIKLTDSIFKKKKKIMSELYGFDPDGIDIGYSTNPEAFLFKII